MRDVFGWTRRDDSEEKSRNRAADASPILHDVATEFLSKQRVAATSSKRLFLWDGRCYRPRNIDQMKAEVIKIMPRGRLVEKLGVLVDIIAARAHIDEEELLVASTFAGDGSGDLLINCNNGLLRYRKKKEQYMLCARDPNLLFTGCLAANYDPEADCPIALRVFPQIQPDEQDQAQIQYQAAYCLIPDCRFETIFVWYGTGGNGKDTYAVLFTSVFGEDLLCHYDLKTLNDSKKYGLQDLRYSLLNLGTELHASVLEETNVIKALASGQSIHTREPFERHLKLLTACKHLFLANWLPHLRKGSQGDARRINMTHFSQVFDFGKRDTSLKEQIARERDGLFNLILDALPPLLAMEAIPKGGKQSQAVEARAGLRMDPLGEFIKECLFCDDGPDSQIRDGRLWAPKRDITQAYRLFVEDEMLGAGLLYTDAFWGQLKNTLSYIRIMRPSKPEWLDNLRRLDPTIDVLTRPRVVIGICLKPKWHRRVYEERRERPDNWC